MTEVQDDSKLTAFEIKQRRLRTCFVGNIPLDVTGKQIKLHFTNAGFKVEKVWFRSIATHMDSKIPTIKAKVIV
jgi:RNA recognition motif-containing protein